MFLGVQLQRELWIVPWMGEMSGAPGKGVLTLWTANGTGMQEELMTQQEDPRLSGCTNCKSIKAQECFFGGPSQEPPGQAVFVSLRHD